MRLLLVAFFIWHISSEMIAQNNMLFGLKDAEKRGDALYENFSFQRALDAYLYSAKKNPEKDEIKLKVAECYRMLNRPHLAEDWYAKVIENENIIESIHKLHYAQVLSSNGNYDLAKIWYNKYGQENSEDSRTSRKVAALENIHTLLADSLVFFVDALDINSESSDFSPAFFNNGLVFVSGRGQDKGAKNLYNWDHTNFLDLFYTEEHEDGTNDVPTAFHDNIITSFHEGPCTFYDNDTKMVFTANSYINNELVSGKEKITKLKLYYSELDDHGHWVKPVPLPFNDDHYSFGHPTMSANGKLLYFSSDMPGGYGGTDIYKSTHENGKWGTPENIGSLVNTEGNEMFPYVHHDGVLYFASYGHGGLGGLDIYRLTANAKIIDNVGHPFNSRWDDFGLVLDDEGESGYFSSNREGGKGDDDLYYFELKKREFDFIVQDSITGEGIDEVHIALAYKDIGHDFYTDPSGRARSILNPLKDYTGTFTKIGYLPKTISITAEEQLSNDPIVLVDLVPNLLLDASLEYGRSRSGKSIGNVDETTGGGMEFYDDDHGDFDFENIESLEYSEHVELIMVNGDKGWQSYIKTEADFFILQEDASKYFLGNRRKQIALKPIKQWLNPIDRVTKVLNMNGYGVSSIMTINSALYDYDRYLVLNNASAQLDKMVQVLLDNPSLKLILSSHADSRGGVNYNHKLSKKRGASAMNYLKYSGIDKSRIKRYNLGELEPANRCKGNQNCSEAEYEFNRRTTFTLELN